VELDEGKSASRTARSGGCMVVSHLDSGERASNVITDFETKKIKDWLKPNDGRVTLETFMQWQGKQFVDGFNKNLFRHHERWTLYPESLLWGFLAPVAYLLMDLQGLFFMNQIKNKNNSSLVARNNKEELIRERLIR
jgi:hypothetical protein